VAALEVFMQEHTASESAVVRSLKEAQTALQVEVAENTKTTNAVKDDTTVVREFVQAYRAVNMLGGLATRALLWLALVGGGLAAMWVALKTGKLP
jgi:hypothetical protein